MSSRLGPSWTSNSTGPGDAFSPLGRSAKAAARRRRRRQMRLVRRAVLLVVLIVLLAWLTGGFGGGNKAKKGRVVGGGTNPPPANQPTTTVTTVPPPPPGPVTAQALTVHLPTTSSRSVVVTDGTSILVLGGLNNQAKSSSAVYRFDPQAGTVQQDGPLTDDSLDA